jgi:hypothetical protein
MEYYKIHNYYSWFEDDKFYINNSGIRETNVWETKNYVIGSITNTSIFRYKEWIILKDTDKIIDVDSIQMNNIIECKQRELKLNKILDDL